MPGFRLFQILVSAPARRLVLAAAGVALLGACGQKGPLYLPQGEAAAGRTTLGEIITPAPSTAVTTPRPAASAVPESGKAVPGVQP
ncbi:hypothetical protein HHL11_28260 [Ramlibacter sp. G-1-2-2]|uniref:Lipoprotein n=1 Tax=Ramlibacter agri TaxID=2728837 RepID=A0A848H9J7_9BURK|nr:hypothetical protein [Ramlibacter agri]